MFHSRGRNLNVLSGYWYTEIVLDLGLKIDEVCTNNERNLKLLTTASLIFHEPYT